MSEDRRPVPRPTGKRPALISPISSMGNLSISRNEATGSTNTPRREWNLPSIPQRMNATRQLRSESSPSSHRTAKGSRERSIPIENNSPYLHPSTPDTLNTTIAQDRAEIVDNLRSVLRLTPPTKVHEHELISGITNIMDRYQQEALHVLSAPDTAYYMVQKELAEMRRQKDQLGQKLGEAEREIQRLRVGERDTKNRIQAVEYENKQLGLHANEDLQHMRNRMVMETRNLQIILEGKESELARKVKEHAAQVEKYAVEVEILKETNAELREEVDAAEKSKQQTILKLLDTKRQLQDKRLQMQETEIQLDMAKKSAAEWKAIAEMLEGQSDNWKEMSQKLERKVYGLEEVAVYWKELANARASSIASLRQESTQTANPQAYRALEQLVEESTADEKDPKLSQAMAEAYREAAVEQEAFLRRLNDQTFHPPTSKTSESGWAGKRRDV